jgi:selenocysteine lyase/cysteine desulfurase
MRFMGATFDPSTLYRFLHVRRMLTAEGLTTARVSARVEALKHRLVEHIAETPLATAELLDPPSGPARFLAFRGPKAAEWQASLMAEDCITDVRGDVLRVGLGLYHDEGDVERFAKLAAALS